MQYGWLSYDSLASCSVGSGASSL